MVWHTGEILNVLLAVTRVHSRVHDHVLEQRLVDRPELLRTEVAGVVAYELATGDLHVFHSKATVFATGGSGRMYKTTSNAHTLTGDGMAIAFRNGLPLEDMEFVQFHPTGLAGLGILVSEAARGEGRGGQADGDEGDGVAHWRTMCAQGTECVLNT